MSLSKTLLMKQNTLKKDIRDLRINMCVLRYCIRTLTRHSRINYTDYTSIQWTRVLYSVVTTRKSNPPISQFNSPCYEFTSFWSMFVYNIYNTHRFSHIVLLILIAVIQKFKHVWISCFKWPLQSTPTPLVAKLTILIWITKWYTNASANFQAGYWATITQRTINGVLTTNQGCYPLRLPLPERKGRSPR